MEEARKAVRIEGGREGAQWSLLCGLWCDLFYHYESLPVLYFMLSLARWAMGRQSRVTLVAQECFHVCGSVHRE